jgi:preprotein translocase subunit SecD
MRAARYRGAAIAGSIALALLASFQPARAEPLRVAVASASAGADPYNGKPMVFIRLTDESSRSFAKFSAAHVGQMIDTRIDGKSVMKPIIREPIAGGNLWVTIDSAEEARRIADTLSRGTAKLEVEAVSQ